MAYFWSVVESIALLNAAINFTTNYKYFYLLFICCNWIKEHGEPGESLRSDYAMFFQLSPYIEPLLDLLPETLSAWQTITSINALVQSECKL